MMLLRSDWFQTRPSPTPQTTLCSTPLATLMSSALTCRSATRAASLSLLACRLACPQPPSSSLLFLCSATRVHVPPPAPFPQIPQKGKLVFNKTYPVRCRPPTGRATYDGRNVGMARWIKSAESLLAEARPLISLRHRQLAAFFGFKLSQRDDTLIFESVSEFCGGGSLETRLTHFGPLDMAVGSGVRGRGHAHVHTSTRPTAHF